MQENNAQIYNKDLEEDNEEEKAQEKGKPLG